jgi:hypothetical protein
MKLNFLIEVKGSEVNKYIQLWGGARVAQSVQRLGYRLDN